MMTLEQAQELEPGDFVKVLEDGEDEYGSFTAGAIGIVDDVFPTDGPQKVIVTVLVEGYICNAFDAEDNYPLEKVDPMPVYQVKLSGLIDMTTSEQVIAATPEQAVEMVLKRDHRHFVWEVPDHDLIPMESTIEAYEVLDPDDELVFSPPQASTWEVSNARRLREALQAVLPYVDIQHDAASAAAALLAEFTSG